MIIIIHLDLTSIDYFTGTLTMFTNENHFINQMILELDPGGCGGVNH